MIFQKINKLKEEITKYLHHVKSMIELSIEGFINKDKELLETIINQKEKVANKKEIDIEELAMLIITKFAPKAVDMRTVIMIMKINNDLERIADHAVNIANDGLYLVKRPSPQPIVDIRTMADTSIEMMEKSIKAFIHNDAELAQEVLQLDDRVDDLNRRYTKELVANMMDNSELVERCISFLKTIHDIERIADLSTNICEDVIFIVEAKNIKHKGKK